MRKIFSIVFLVILHVSCSKKDSVKEALNIEDYVSLEYNSFNNNGELISYVSPTIIENPDSIGKVVTQYSRRIRYLLTNRINIDTLNQLIPDSTAINRIFKKEIYNKKFKDYFKRIINPNKQPKETFSDKEMMKIGSRFFLAEELPDTSFGTRICSGVNGIIEEENKKDYTLLEAIIFDAIFDVILQQNVTKTTFMDNQDKYLDIAIKKSANLKKDSQIHEIRSLLFESMENDIDLKEYLVSYFEVNQDNIPIKIIVN